MATTLSLSEARRRLSEITEETRLNGEEFIILKNGKEAARIMPPGTPSPATEAISPEFYERLRGFSDRFSHDLELLSGS
jgi:prevent-host-death family protein